MGKSWSCCKLCPKTTPTFFTPTNRQTVSSPSDELNSVRIIQPSSSTTSTPTSQSNEPSSIRINRYRPDPVPLDRFVRECRLPVSSEIAQPASSKSPKSTEKSQKRAQGQATNDSDNSDINQDHFMIRSGSEKYDKILKSSLTVRKVQEIAKDQAINRNPQMMLEFLKTLSQLDEIELNWNDIELINDPNRPTHYTLETLPSNSLEYNCISLLFKGTNKPCYTIQKILKVFNPYLMLQYKLKHLELKYYEKKKVQQLSLFHGTYDYNLDDICRLNFNWRSSGKNKNELGQAVYFATNAYYATHYGDKLPNKVMIVAKVLIGGYNQGSRNTMYPIPGNDACCCQRTPTQVFAKYDDNSFYPAYIIRYYGVDLTKKQKRKQ